MKIGIERKAAQVRRSVRSFCSVLVVIVVVVLIGRNISRELALVF